MFPNENLEDLAVSPIKKKTFLTAHEHIKVSFKCTLQFGADFSEQLAKPNGVNILNR